MQRDDFFSVLGNLVGRRAELQDSIAFSRAILGVLDGFSTTPAPKDCADFLHAFRISILGAAESFRTDKEHLIKCVEGRMGEVWESGRELGYNNHRTMAVEADEGSIRPPARANVIRFPSDRIEG